jgi:hypothetical protein
MLRAYGPHIGPALGWPSGSSGKRQERMTCSTVEGIACRNLLGRESIVRKSCKSLVGLRKRNFHELTICVCVGGVHRTRSDTWSQSD